MPLKIDLVTQLSQWFRSKRHGELPLPPEEASATEVRLPEVVVPPLWQNTKLPTILKRIALEATQLDDPALLSAAEHEIAEAKAAHRRRASVTSAQHLYRAQAYRMLAKASDSPELLSNLAWQLSEHGNYATAAVIGRHAYELASKSGDVREAATPAFKLAIYEFYLGNLAESRKWLQQASKQMHGWEDYISFERRIALCEQAEKALSTEWNGEGDYEALRDQSDRALSDNDLPRSLAHLQQAYQAAQKSNNQEQIYEAQSGIANLLYKNVRFFAESSSWYLKAFRTALGTGNFSVAAEALLNAAQAHLETGNTAVTSEILRGGLRDLGAHVEGLPLSRIYVTLAFVASDHDPALAVRSLDIATEKLTTVPPEDVLEWALAYGRWFVSSEKADLAIRCLNAGFKIAQSSYYSPRVSSIFREAAHINFLQEKWTTCLLLLNESRNRSYVNHDVEGVCAALLHAAQVYKSGNERGLAAKTINSAMTIGRDIRDQRLRQQIGAFWSEANLELNPLEPDSGWNAALQEILREPPGSYLFNVALRMIRSDVRQIESIKDIGPYYDSGSFRFPFIMRAYGVALDRSGDQRQAKDYLARAYRIYRGMKDYPEAASTLHEYAVASARLGLYHIARRAFLVALSLKKRYGSSTGSSADSLLGFVHASIRLRYASGLAECLAELLKEAESGISMWAGPEAYDIGGVQMIAAEGYLLLGNTEEADKLAAQVKESVPELLPEDFSATSLLHLARFELQRKRADQSLHYARQALEFFEKTRPKIVGPQHRTELQREEVPATWAFIAAAYELGISQAGPALRSTEFAKVRSLLERFGRTRVPIPPGFPEELRRQDGELRSMTDDLLRKIRAARTVQEREELTAKLGDIELFEQNFVSKAADKFPAYAQLRSGVPLDPSEITRNYLSSDDITLLALFPSEDATFVWYLNRDGTTREWYRVSVSRDKINQLGHSLQSKVLRREWTSSLLDEVVNALLKDCLRSIAPGTPLCLVAGGSLLQIPLCAARVGDGYLCERHPTALLPSFSLAAFWERAERIAGPAAVFADSLGDLLYARKEADIVASTLNCQQLKGKQVTREGFLTTMSSCDLLHVACHADYDANDPLNSGIRLRGDQRLTCRDLMTVNTRARFAFLSACDTGRLMIRAGDELEGLASSIMYSGFEAVVGSLWRVPDRQTRQLVEVFYEHLKNGKDLARCLQAGQLHILKNTETSSPYFWGAWQVVGNWNLRFG